MKWLVVTALVVQSSGAISAAAQPLKTPRIAVTGGGAIGEETDSDELTAALARDIVALGLGEVISTREIARAIKQAKKPQLSACEGDRGCLAEFGRTVGAELVVGVEVGGLGEVRVVHLKVIGTGDGKLVRQTTSTLSGKSASEASIVELLAPERYRGALKIETVVEGAEVIVDGRALGKTPASEFALEVGTRALRVTHPSYRDQVRFIEIEYGKTTTVSLDMVALEVSRRELEREGEGGILGADGKSASEAARPWYARWYVVAGVGAVALAGSIAIWAATSDSFDVDREVGLPFTDGR